MMTKVLLYGYAVGVYSGRKLAKAIETDVAFRFLAAPNFPGHRTIIRSRREHRVALGKLFTQVLDAFRAAGLVKLGTVSIDGTKIKGGASKYKAMSHKRMVERQDEYTKAIEDWFDRSDREDDEDDTRLGKDSRGGELRPRGTLVGELGAWHPRDGARGRDGDRSRVLMVARFEDECGGGRVRLYRLVGDG